MQIEDYSYLKPEEARAKFSHLANRIYAEQFHQSFFVKDVRPELYLKYELHAYLTGTIKELRGWTNPLGQALSYVYDRLTSWFWGFWDWTIRPGIEGIVRSFKWIWDNAVSWAKNAYYKAWDVWYKLTNLADFVQYRIYYTLSDIWNRLGGIGTTISSYVSAAISVVRDWLSQLWYNYIRPGVKEILSGFKWIWESTKNIVQSIQEHAVEILRLVSRIHNILVTNFGDIVRQIRTLWDRLSGVVDRVVGEVERRIWGVVDVVREAIDGVIRDIRPILDNIKGSISSVIRTALRDLEEWIGGVREYIIRQVSSAIEGLSKAVSDIWGNITRALTGLWDRISGAFDALRRWIRPILDDLWGNISRVFDDVRVWMQRNIVERVSGVFEALSKQVAALPQVIASAFKTAISYLRDVLSSVWEDILIPFGKTIEGGVKTVLQGATNTLWTFFGGFYNTILSLGPINPAVAKDNVPMIMKLAIEGAMGLGSAYLIGELLHPLKQVGLGHVAAMIYKASNYDLVTGAVIGALATAAFGQPLKYAFNEVFRPYLLSWGDVSELHSRGKLTEEEVLMFMKFYGYPDAFKRWFDELAITPLSRMDLRYVARYGYYDADLYKEEIQRMGHSDLGAETIHKIAVGEYMESVRRYYVDYLWDRYALGITTKEHLRQEIAAMGFPEPMHPPLVQIGEVRRDTEHVKDMINSFKFSYRRGRIDLQAFKARLAGLGLDSQRVNDIVAVEAARGYEERYQTDFERLKVYSDAVVRRRFKEGMLTEGEFIAEMKAIGYSESYARRMLIGARLERDYDFAMTVLRYVKRAYIKKRIDDTRFINMLRSYGFTDDKILLELDLIKLAYGLGLKEEEVA